jgi:protein SCO1/2
MGDKRAQPLKWHQLVILAVAALVGGAAAGLLIVPGAVERLVPQAGVVSVGKALVGGPFSLIDQTGRRVTDQDFRGRHMLVYFGFTYCPDICPSALQLMTAALDELGPKADKIQPIFITVDPERDTPEQLAKYVTSFHPRLIGLTGSLPEIQSVAKAYRVYFQKAKDENSSADAYTMDHTSIIYLMGPDGGYVTHFTHATPLKAIVEQLRKAL